MEGVIAMADDVLSTVKKDAVDPDGIWTPTAYEAEALPERPPDTTPDAGTRITEAPDYLWVPPEVSLRLEVPESCPRVSCIVQLAWQGGDPGVDLPDVTLQVETSEGVWEDVLTAAGRPIGEEHHDILLAWTPDPLYPADDPQSHAWWAAWQAVGHVRDRMGLPTGTYRLHVVGHAYAGGASTWPWPSTEYTLDSDPFEVTEATISLEVAEGGLWAWVQAPVAGWRLVDVDGDEDGPNPLRGTLRVSWSDDGGGIVEETVVAQVSGGRSWIAISLPSGKEVTVTDAYGNSGTVLNP
jgi:hypothetical protein